MEPLVSKYLAIRLQDHIFKFKLAGHQPFPHQHWLLYFGTNLLYAAISATLARHG
ncbi:hypothetical protein PILCRDRAFT_818556 [Piloderma croceum F 1598]|uniref:Uncharacterized protein n=1 Tax=Piloderma croceum (strain F 1598) TaxID=765440 RepID=A0A0C3FXE3_PILCF|nr:hypothetical protein PILCRDRAFT_818556 [Piloderma croceum F 1598]